MTCVICEQPDRRKYVFGTNACLECVEALIAKAVSEKAARSIRFHPGDLPEVDGRYPEIGVREELRRCDD